MEELLVLGVGLTSGRVEGAERLEGAKGMEAVARRAGMAAAYAWGWVMGWAGLFAMNQGDLGRAVALLEETVAAARSIGEMASGALALQLLGSTLLRMGDVVRGVALVEESVAQARRSGGDGGYLPSLLVQAGDSLLFAGPGAEDRAAALAEEGLELAQRADQLYWEAYARHILAQIAVRHEELAQARAQAATALRVARDLGATLMIPIVLYELAIVAAREGRGERSARLMGAVARLLETRGIQLRPDLNAEIRAAVLEVRAALGEEQWAKAFAAGRALSLDESIAEALEEPRSPAGADYRRGSAAI
jgi:hypothetical protein